MNFVYLVFVFLCCYEAINCQNKTSCPSNFYGKNCDYTNCTQEEYQVNQCRNGGLCIKNKQNYKCLCKSHYSGPLCDKPLCLDYCLNDGKCSIVNNTSQLCLCNTERYSGDRCQFDKCLKKADECPANCVVNSACDCLCGEQCDKSYCNNKNGTCYEQDGKLICKCRTGFSNPVCLIDDCAGYCFSGGTCVRGTNSIYCLCPNGYTNSRCSKKISEVPYAYRSSKAVFYAITVTIIICLIAIGAYYSIQRGYFQNMLPINLRTKLETKTSDDREQLNSTESNRSNIHFNKLIEDEIQNEVLA